MVQTCTHESYTVGIICALAVEKAAVEAMLDEEHSRLAAMAGDDNSYSLGRTGEHHVVVACLPAGVTGKASTVTVARDRIHSFPIKAGFMVGIGGGGVKRASEPTPFCSMRYASERSIEGYNANLASSSSAATI
ncbi:hypothetical protein LTR02_009114 [Friedmanniomyces endolithicus]|nr:hypothetical protein LTR02_009114 [Friedmanniomyces endolithicus]